MRKGFASAQEFDITQEGVCLRARLALGIFGKGAVKDDTAANCSPQLGLPVQINASRGSCSEQLGSIFRLRETVT